MSRTERLQQLADNTWDVVVIGAGINGAVAAAALAARGVRVALLDRGDFGGETSSNSSCLVWGGIKYLESGDWRLVADLCQSRNRLLQCFPSSVREIRFLATLPKGFRKPAWMFYSGAWLYWLMGFGKTRRPEWLSASQRAEREPLFASSGAEPQQAVEYSDAWLVDNDSRFTFGFVRSAVQSGALAINYVEAQGSEPDTSLTAPVTGWVTHVCDQRSGATALVRSRFIINAAGPWLDDFNRRSGLHSGFVHRFSRGIHLLVPRISSVERVLAFFASDGRLFFAIPMGKRTCIGTTDVEVDSPTAVVSADERQFVLDNINRLLALTRPLVAADVISERCGVRPLVVPADSDISSTNASMTDWQHLSRRHQLVNGDGWLGIYGGKLTDCLNVGEEVCAALKQQGLALGDERAGWLGEAGPEQRDDFMAAAWATGLNEHTRPDALEPLSERLWRRYGPAAADILHWGVQDPDLWLPVLRNDDLLRAEVMLAARDEMIETLEDFLRRRTMIALTIPCEQLCNDPGLAEIARLLFGAQASERLEEFFQTRQHRIQQPAGTTPAS
ncbi:glycerol-3-phosphate dehydrogenase/oxidase [Parathalassolituus penaei]|uniref:FAD-dependent oxidoreductase n=1 Tax=Parathalassolituus penaei TaxID=2997323 RepID=A0A9X3EG53_9GAMM|nr:FAD-dependent oxidoreductase [Parathalassolituus penaei]MCY0966899.1 FAD-dependent oxidoreductase [Parathalassolituus penaei]